MSEGRELRGDAAGAQVAAHRVVTTAGHVDHGKSTLLRTLTGMEPDRLAEEQRRGLTIDLGYVWTRLAGAGEDASVEVAFVDVPGHERFVATMLAGAGAAPSALLVVAADDGWSAQSSEHRDVLDLLGVPALAVAITKVDLVAPGRVDEVVGEVAEATAGTSLAGAPVVPVDASRGTGVDELVAALVSGLAALPAPPDLGRPRLWVDRSFPISGAGTVVTGTLVGGRLDVGTRAALLPAGAEVRVRGLQALGRDVGSATPGTRVAANLAGVSHHEVARGAALVAGDGPWRVTAAVDLWVRTVAGQRLERAGAWHLHVGTARTTSRVLPTVGPIEPGGWGAVRVLLDHPLPLVAGDRVVLRDAGRRATVAGGFVVDPAPVRRPRGREERAAHAASLRDAVAAATGADGAGPTPGAAGAVAAARAVSSWVGSLVRLAGGLRPTEEALAAGGAVDAASVTGEGSGLEAVGDHLVDRDVLARWYAAVRALGAGVHDRHDVTSAVAAHGAPAGIGAGLVDHLLDTGVLVRAGTGLALAEHGEVVVDEAARRAAALVADLDAEPFAPPDLAELARRHGVDHRQLLALTHRGEVVRCGKVAFSGGAVRAAVARLEEVAAAAPDGRFTASEARTAWGTSRRYAIPLLEHLDRIGVTRFDGQHRTLTGKRP
jgi:selenocysteine-specific elongation factor